MAKYPLRVGVPFASCHPYDDRNVSQWILEIGPVDGGNERQRTIIFERHSGSSRDGVYLKSHLRQITCHNIGMLMTAKT